MGKIPLDFFQLSRDKLPKMSLGERAQFMATVSLKSCYMKVSLLSVSGEEWLTLQTQKLDVCYAINLMFVVFIFFISIDGC